MSITQPSNDYIETPEEKVRIKTIAERLNSSVSTLNRYSRALESAGHSFTKNGNTRLYSLNDEELLAKMLQCTDPNQLGLSIELAANTVLYDENALDEKLNQFKKTQNENELTIRDFSKKLDDLLSTLSENFITKNELSQITNMLETITLQENQKEDIIQKQNELIQKLELERKQDKEQVEQLMELYKKSEDRHIQALETMEWQQGKMDEVGKQLETVHNKLDDLKQKKGFLSSLFKK